MKFLFKNDTIQSISSSHIILKNDNHYHSAIFRIIKGVVPIQTIMCLWLPKRKTNFKEEYKRCSNEKILLLIYERHNGMIDKSLQHAIQSMQKYCFCIISGLLQSNHTPIRL